MAEIEFFYERLEPNFLLDLLKNDDIANTLAYMVDFKNHKKLNVIPHKHSIEISNKEITIVVIFFVGFESDELKKLQLKNNLHLITFSEVLPTMWEFEELEIKIINNISLLFQVLSRSKKSYGIMLNTLKNLNI